MGLLDSFVEHRKFLETTPGFSPYQRFHAIRRLNALEAWYLIEDRIEFRGRKEAVQILMQTRPGLKVSKTRIWEWEKRYREHGPMGLIDRRQKRGK